MVHQLQNPSLFTLHWQIKAWVGSSSSYVNVPIVLYWIYFTVQYILLCSHTIVCPVWSCLHTKSADGLFDSVRCVLEVRMQRIKGHSHCTDRLRPAATHTFFRISALCLSSPVCLSGHGMTRQEWRTVICVCQCSVNWPQLESMAVFLNVLINVV